MLAPTKNTWELAHTLQTFYMLLLFMYVQKILDLTNYNYYVH